MAQFMTDVSVTNGDLLHIESRRPIHLRVSRRHWYGTVLQGTYIDVVISTPRDRLERFSAYMPQFHTAPDVRNGRRRLYQVLRVD